MKAPTSVFEASYENVEVCDPSRNIARVDSAECSWNCIISEII